MTTATMSPGPISQADPIYPYSVQPADLRPNGPWRLVWMLGLKELGVFPTYAEAHAEALRLMEGAEPQDDETGGASLCD